MITYEASLSYYVSRAYKVIFIESFGHITRLGYFLQTYCTMMFIIY